MNHPGHTSFAHDDIDRCVQQWPQPWRDTFAERWAIRACEICRDNRPLGDYREVFRLVINEAAGEGERLLSLA